MYNIALAESIEWKLLIICHNLKVSTWNQKPRPLIDSICFSKYLERASSFLANRVSNYRILIMILSNETTTPAASIVPATENVYTMGSHVIYCTISDITSQATDVRWDPARKNVGGYTLDDGSFNEDNKSQVSSLTISSNKLVDLRNKGAVHTFTCSCAISIENVQVSVTATKTISIFYPGIILSFIIFNHLPFCG